jgi:hypothetical protein
MIETISLHSERKNISSSALGASVQSQRFIGVIIVECCRTVDVMMFNALIDSGDLLTIRLTRQLADKIRDRQKIFQCIFGNITTAFKRLLNLMNIIELDRSKSK